MSASRIALAAALAVSLAGCAKRPDAIAPAAIPMSAYQNLDCQQLAAEYLVEYQNMAALAKAQNDAATGDAMGVFLVGVPVSSVFGGNQEGNLAVAKGKVQAIESAMLALACERPIIPAPPPEPTPPNTAVPT